MLSQVSRGRKRGSSARRKLSAVDPVRGRPRPNTRRRDHLLLDLRVASVPVLDRQPDGEESGRLVPQHGQAELVERAGPLGTVEQRDQALMERVRAQIVQAGS